MATSTTGSTFGRLFHCFLMRCCAPMHIMAHATRHTMRPMEIFSLVSYPPRYHGFLTCSSFRKVFQLLKSFIQHVNVMTLKTCLVFIGHQLPVFRFNISTIAGKITSKQPPLITLMGIMTDGTLFFFAGGCE